MPQRKLTNEEIKSVVGRSQFMVEGVVERIAEEIYSLEGMDRESFGDSNYTELIAALMEQLQESLEEMEVEYQPSKQEIAETKAEIEFDRMRDEGEI